MYGLLRELQCHLDLTVKGKLTRNVARSTILPKDCTYFCTALWDRSSFQVSSHDGIIALWQGHTHCATHIISATHTTHSATTSTLPPTLQPHPLCHLHHPLCNHIHSATTPILQPHPLCNHTHSATYITHSATTLPTLQPHPLCHLHHPHHSLCNHTHSATYITHTTHSATTPTLPPTSPTRQPHHSLCNHTYSTLSVSSLCPVSSITVGLVEHWSFPALETGLCLDLCYSSSGHAHLAAS